MEGTAVADHALTAPVEKFIAELTPELAAVARDVKGTEPSTLTDDVTMEAYNLVGGFIDADSRHTDEELWAFLTTFAPRFDTVLQFATPADVRKAALLDGKRSWLAAPSVLFDILAKARPEAARRYIDLAMRIAHTVCSLDEHPSDQELRALEQFRTMLLKAVPTSAVEGGGAAAVVESEAELPPERPLDELMAELDGLVGLAGVKAEVKLVTNLLQVQKLRKERGLAVAESSRHLVFTGNPGTGKTTVARLLAQIYRTLGVVEKGHLVETDRPGLVAGYVGQTALKVKAVFERALGGFLLIDEAYALARGGENDFGMEAIDTIVKLVEDHRDDVVVVAAGYPDEMHEFVESNPGLRSRFPKTIAFPDYSNEELLAIFESLCSKASYTCDATAKERALSFFAAQPRDKGFGNGRLARNLFEASIARQASRIVAMDNPSNEVLVTLTGEDVAPG